MATLTKPAFTLIELLIAVAIIGTLAVVTVPRFVLRARAGYERKQFIAQLDSLVALGWQQAIISQKTQAIDINFETRQVTLETETTERDRDNEKGTYLFKPVTGTFLQTEIAIPTELSLASLFIEGKSELGRTSKEKAHFWFFIVPEGLAQEVIINLTDKKDLDSDGRPYQVGLVLNPFMVRFKEYDSFQKP